MYSSNKLEMIYKISLKRIKTETVFTKTDLNKDWNINFL